MTDIRPRDYGDQFPSDAGDEKPKSQTQGFQEVDYDPQSFRGQPKRPSQAGNIVPDLQTPPVLPHGRDTWFGLIVEIKNLKDIYPRRYTVLLQDGKLVGAICFRLSEFEKYNVGDDVTGHLYAGEDGYVITGHARRKESQILTLRGKQEVIITDGNVIELSKKLLQIPVDDTFSDHFPHDIILDHHPTGYQITIGQPGEAIYEVSYVVELQNETAFESPNPIYWQTGCWKKDDLVDTNGNYVYSAKAFFNEQVGFRLYYDSRDCTANIALYSPLKYSMLNQQGSGEFPFWTSDPILGGDLTVGYERGTGWLIIGNQDTYVRQSHGGANKLSIRWPRTVATGVGQTLQVAGVSGECVQLKWGKKGSNKKQAVMSCEIESWSYCYIYTSDRDPQYCATPKHKCLDLEFDNGILIAGPDEQSQTGQAACDGSIRVNFKPCGDGEE